MGIVNEKFQDEQQKISDKNAKVLAGSIWHAKDKTTILWFPI